MAKDKESFVLYRDSKALVEQLPDDVAGRLFKHIFKYVYDEKPTSDELLLNVAFAHFRQHLKRDLKKYYKQQEQRSEAGRRSAEVRKQKSTSVKKQTTSSIDEIVEQYDKFIEEVKRGEHTQAIEQIYMRLHLEDGALTPLIKQFKGQLIIDNVVHQNTTEVRKHFNNWLNVLDRAGKLETYKNGKVKH
jgi:flagellar biosynthesis component FlhA